MKRDDNYNANYLSQLNLHTPPFITNSDEAFFYADPERSKYLDMLHHLLQYSGETLLLTGEPGSGKSTLLEKLAARADEQWLVCHIDCSEANTADALFTQIAACFNLQVGNDVQGMLEAFHSQLEELQQQHFLVLLIDEAQNLSEDALEMAMHLATLDANNGKLLHLVLAGGDQLVERLRENRYSALPPPHKLELEGMGEAHSTAYLMRRLQAAGHDGDSPFSVAEIKQLHKETNGLPGPLNSAANRLLNSKYGQRLSSNLRRMLQAGIAAMALVGTVLGLQDRIAALLGGDEESGQEILQQIVAKKPQQEVKEPLVEKPDVPEEPEVQQPAEPQLVVKKATAKPEQPQLMVKKDPSKSEPIKLAENSTVTAENVTDAGAVEPELQGIEPEKIIGSNEKLRLILRGRGFRPGTKVALSRDGKVKVLQQDLVEYINPTKLAINVTPGMKKSSWALQISTPDNKRSNVLRLEVLPPTISEGTTEETETKEKAAVSSAAAIDTKPQPVKELPVAKPEPVAKPMKKPAVAVAKPHTVSKRASAAQGAEWYSAQPKGNYTLQLLASASRTNINAYIKQHSLPGPLARFSMKKNGRTLHVLTHGSFASKQMAQKAAARLPRGVKSWARSIASIQQVMLAEAVATKPAPTNDAGPDAAWIWSQDPVRYTIQLAAGRNEKAVLQVKTQVTLPGELAIAKALRDGKPWFVLVYGSFPSKESARDTISRLPAGLRESGPWVRSFSSLQDELSRSTPSR